ncbi:MAG: hypothetical protein ACFE9R_02245 [Candidatus Hermodarchaeota archaeon]
MLKSNILLAQVGWRGKIFVKQAIEQKYANGAIFLPRNYDLQKYIELSQYIHRKNGIVLFDSQLYFPQVGNRIFKRYNYYRENFLHGYNESSFNNKDFREKLCNDLITCQDYLSVDAYISPTEFMDSYSEAKIHRFIELSKSFISCAEKKRKIPCLISLPISNTVIVDEDNRNNLLDYLTGLDCSGFYVNYSVERGEGYPLVDPTGISSLMHLLYSLKKNNYYVIMGHSHHISYLLSCTGLDGFATGHFKNTRTFEAPYYQGMTSIARQPATNYFSIALLNDLRVNTDIRMLNDRSFNLDSIKSGSPFENSLFSPAISYAWGKDDSFHHYIWCCNKLMEKLKNKKIEEKINEVQSHLRNAQALYNRIKQVGIPTQPTEKIYPNWIAVLQEFNNLISSKL